MRNTYLCHHGIKGMKWGVRRYRNADGSLTAEGKRRYGDGTASDVNRGKKIAAGIAGGVAAAGFAYAMYNPKSRAIISKIAKSSASSLYKAASSPKVKAFVKKAGKKSIKSISKIASRVGNAMVDAAMPAIAGIATAKLTKKLTTADDAPENVRNRNAVLLEAGKAGIAELAKVSSGSDKASDSSSDKSVGSDVSSVLGQPSKKAIDKSGSEWASLFKDASGNQRPQEVRATVKSLAKDGYDIDQIKRYLAGIDNGTIKHSAFRWKITRRSALTGNAVILYA